MARKFFGTDGIRGKANIFPMTGDIAFKLGQATARVFKSKEAFKVIIGKDTRRSGYIFEYALTAGLCSLGADVYLVGPMPTPAVAHLVRSFAADLGVVISASHNPAGDNGIKFFDSRGYKLPDDVEEKIEELIFSDKLNTEDQPIAKVGRAFRIDDATGRYIEFAKGSINNQSLSGIKLVLDCAHGAAYKAAPPIFKELGADIEVFGNKPDGLNINQGCGALHTELIQTAVLESRSDIGIALDGDADRIMIVDEKGHLVDGDQILAICALHMKKHNTLVKNTVVGTVMSNMGLAAALKEKGIGFVATRVGDRYVIEEMKKHGYNLGGEQSGHIIMSDFNSTGDGTMSGLQILNIMKQTGLKLSELRVFEPYPQVLKNIMVKEKKPLEKMKSVQTAIKNAEKTLGSTGRVLVRYSGTENKCRVMVEAKDAKVMNRCVKSIAGAILMET